LLGRYIAKILYDWDDKKFNQEYWRWLERNWLRWKEKKRLERIIEEEKEEEVEEERIEK